MGRLFLRVIVDAALGLLLAGVLAPLVLLLLPEDRKGPAVLWLCAIGGIAIVTLLHELLRQGRSGGQSRGL